MPMMMSAVRRLMRCVCLFALLAGVVHAEDRYLVGGPLAGIELPRHPNGDWGEVELYPGGVEHYRAYWMKYCQVRSFWDRQSQLANFVVPNIPGMEGRPVEEFAAPTYILQDSTTDRPTGKFRPPVKVVRCKVKDPVFKLDLGELPVGLYALRVIAAVETDKLRRFRLPLFLTMKINDGPDGEISTYRLRCGYVDDFYSIAEFYFHAPRKDPRKDPRKQHYKAELYVDEGSEVELLVHNISLDDQLAGSERRAIKTRRTFHSDDEMEAKRKSLASSDAAKNLAKFKPLDSQTRLERDRAIWRWLPPINAQGSWLDYNTGQPGVSGGVASLTGEEIVKEYGAWDFAGHREFQNIDHNVGVLSYDPKLWNQALVNSKLGIQYTIDDLWAGRPLPDPYPFKDAGQGLFFPDPNDPAKGRRLDIIANMVGRRYRSTSAGTGAYDAYLATGKEDFARDAALSLIRFAYQYPTLDSANWLDSITVQPGPYGRDSRCRQRDEMQRWMPHYANYTQIIKHYDLLFDYINGNQQLADAVGRFVPWVKTPADVIELLDVYLVQYGAKRILRYHDYTGPMEITAIATVLGDARVTDPWMEWQFSRTFVYPLEPAGIQDLMISGCDRAGPEFIGSTYYAGGEGASRIAADLEPYLLAGGNPKFDLRDAKKYPKPVAHCYWSLNTTIAGRDFARIGDVTGPEKPMGMMLDTTVPALAQPGWRWTGDPIFAWIVRHAVGRKSATDAQWTAIERAANGVKRAPWLDLRSRFVPNWFGALESGLQHDDHRFRRAAYVRTGIGSGHHHSDTLDLQVVAHGLPMTIDDGQRSGYSKPNSRFSRVHNVVEVDARGNNEYGLWSDAWLKGLSDGDGARYLNAQATPANHARLMNRQIAMIDVDEGRGSTPLTPQQQVTAAGLPTDIETPRSYVFDVFRVDGGSVHTYCFHGMVNDAFEWNASNVQPVEHVKATLAAGTEAEYLAIFESSPESKFAGDAPATLTADWRYSREDTRGNEQAHAGKMFSADSPRKHTRLHLLDTEGLRALRADVVCNQLGYRFTNLMAQKRGKDKELQSAFVALIEPYSGKPFIEQTTMLPITGNETDALRAVAVEVKTTTGHRDVLFADGRPEKARKVGALTIAGEFAAYGTDDKGLRLASLTGGTQLLAADVRIEAKSAENRGVIRRVNYWDKTLDVDGDWPRRKSASVAHIVTNGGNLSDNITGIADAGEGLSRLTTAHSADAYRSPIGRIGPAGRRMLSTDGFDSPSYKPGPIAGQGHDDETIDASGDVWQAGEKGPQIIKHGGGHAMALTAGNGSATRPIALRVDHSQGFAAMRFTLREPITEQRILAGFSRKPYGGDDSAMVAVRPVPGTRGSYHIGVGMRPTSQTFATKPLIVGREYVIIWHWTKKDGGTYQLWIDPKPGDLETPTIQTNGHVDQQTRLNITQAVTGLIDDLQVATSWSEVYIPPRQATGDDALPQRTHVAGRVGHPMVRYGHWAQGFHASNDDATKTWRANFISESTLEIIGPAITEADFAPANVIRAWHYGVGDTVRQPTSVTLRRIDDNMFSLTADVEVTLSLKAAGIEQSSDKATWTRVPTQTEAGLARFTIPVGHAIDAPLFLRLR